MSDYFGSYNSPRSKSLRLFNYFLLITFLIIIIIPLYTIVIASFKTNEEFIYSSVFKIPENFFNFDNYIYAFKEGNMIKALGNTLFVMIISLFINVLFGTMVGYIMSRFEFRLKKLILFLFIGAALLPPIITTMSIFKIIKSMNLFNNLMGLVMIFISTNIVAIYIFIQFIMKIPKEIDESALIDGASYFRIYAQILMPLMKPAIITVVILVGINIYNDFYWPMIITPKSDLQVLTTSLLNFTSGRGNKWNIISAGIFIIMTPLAVFYLLLQRFIISGVVQGAVKG